MKPTNRDDESSKEKLSMHEPHPWLQKHYQEKRERTVHLVKASVDQLVKGGQGVTIEAVCRTSAQIDPEGRGVKKSALLENQEAHAYYREHSRSYQTSQARKRTSKSGKVVAQARPLRIDPQRDGDRARYRYLQMTKPEIVERLLQVEQAYAELVEQQAHLQFKWAELELRSVSERKQQHSTRMGKE